VGRRNQTLFRLGCAMRRHGADEVSILDTLRRENNRRCVPPLDDVEISRTAHSAAGYEPNGNDVNEVRWQRDQADSCSDPEPLPCLHDAVLSGYKSPPPVLRDYVGDIAERMQAPPDYPAMACIVMCGSVIGRKLRIYPRQHGDWGIVPNLWAMAIGRPGFKKSPSLDAALAPIHKLQDRAFEQ